MAAVAAALGAPVASLTPRAPAAEAVEPVWAPPIVHTLAVLTVTRSVEAVLWPEPFADFRVERSGYHYGEALTKPPLFDADQPAFRWDHDPWPINVVGPARWRAVERRLLLGRRRMGHPVVCQLELAAIP